jgi:hypothetical protein
MSLGHVPPAGRSDWRRGFGIQYRNGRRGTTSPTKKNGPEPELPSSERKANVYAEACPSPSRRLPFLHKEFAYEEKDAETGTNRCPFPTQKLFSCTMSLAARWTEYGQPAVAHGQVRGRMRAMPTPSRLSPKPRLGQRRLAFICSTHRGIQPERTHSDIRLERTHRQWAQRVPSDANAILHQERSE